MNGHVFHAILRVCIFFVLSCFFVAFVSSGPVRAQSSSPTVIDFWIAEENLFLKVSLNAEALLLGFDPARHEALSGDPQYLSLRRMASSELEPQIIQFMKTWVQDVVVEVPERVALTLESISIPEGGDEETARVTNLLLAAPLSDQTSNLQLRWPIDGGPIVLRQQGVTAPYTGYLTAGETSPLIPLRGGASLTPQQTLQTYFALGINHFTHAPFTPILLALSLVFQSLSLRSVTVQVLFLSAGVFLGLGLAVYDVLNPIIHVQAQVPIAFIIILALWNLVVRRLQVARLLTVFAGGTVFGFGLAAALRVIGVPPDHQLPAILGFGAGVVVPIVLTASAAFGLTLLLAGESHRTRSRISALASILIAGLGVYWLAEPWMLG
ncbi:HupE/UreJ family protein [Ruegeria sp. 6PALISEP08]|uniref:HupE/UreJ family protein n=1 Tax=Ruegeria sp. 6PALISEP08 TaxID=1225660 RepID=UPI00067F46FC|nr:HupE/UreJ family protein [Ruegeria sp. 6PALISEP08]